MHSCQLSRTTSKAIIGTHSTVQLCDFHLKGTNGINDIVSVHRHLHTLLVASYPGSCTCIVTEGTFFCLKNWGIGMRRGLTSLTWSYDGGLDVGDVFLVDEHPDSLGRGGGQLHHLLCDTTNDLRRQILHIRARHL